MFLRYIDILIPILNMSEHRKLYNRETTLFVTKQRTQNISTTFMIHKKHNTLQNDNEEANDEDIKQHVNNSGVFLPAGVMPSEFESDL